VLPGFSTLRILLTLQQVSDEGSLVRRKTFSTAKKIKKDVTVFDENGAEYLRRLRDRQFGGMLLGSVTSAMIE
jgi:hypothetical protein